MIFFLVLALITLVLFLVFCKNCKKKDNELSVSHKSFKSSKPEVFIEQLEIPELPENKERITISILFYPENEEQKEIRVSAHSFKGNEWYTYYQDGFPFQSSEIKPKLVSNNTKYNDILMDYKGPIETEKVIYTSNENIFHTQTFNVIKGVSKIYMLLKFSGNYKITIT